ncbi:Cytosol aminopeptidase [Ferriphaselus amnicola]|uniref:Probable cytosol aminopeptidase n=1 Tax=Ferriphaselus amnicola TaxID=1188319 RepID=A0A2Z6GE38_9PROT|nr:leucyl aminopeptidase [Ferriphaselus amnicola]BBE51612.1 Cytosol aminopeptidase [Ferriphaselus amnicola]
MEFSTKQLSPEKQPGGCVIVGVYENGKLSDAAKALDKASDHALTALITRGDLNGKAGATVLLQQLTGAAADRILLVGLGKHSELNSKTALEAMRAAMRAVLATPATDATLYCTDWDVAGRDAAWLAAQAVLAASDVSYRSDSLKSKPAEAAKLSSLTLASTGKISGKLETAVAQAQATANGIALAKTLGNLPGNICTPTYLAEQALEMGKQHKLKVTVLERADMEALGMGSFLSVTLGSAQPPKLISLEYHGGDKKQKPVVLVGKGITFDTGGISLKPAADMDEMKYDMCGAASVLGTIQAIAEMKLPLNVVGVIPTCENMPSSTATKPGDIVTSMSGQTIEVLNTDAEGRLILCDALTYAAKFKPECVVDIATLTGACVIALGHVVSGLLSNQDDLAQELLDAGEQSWDRAWRLPLYDDYQAQIDSNFADMQNIGGRAGGTITAACFLARFTKDYRWAHLDIAGTANKSGKEKGGTGRPVGLLTQFLVNRAGK